MVYSLPPDIEPFVIRQLQTGRYANAEDVIRTAVQALQKSEALAMAARVETTSRKRSPRGILADLRSNLPFREFREVRDSLWEGRPGRND